MYSSAAKRTLQEERQEGNHEDQEDTDDATIDPGENGTEVVASLRTEELSLLRVSAQRQLRLQGTQEDHWERDLSMKYDRRKE